MEAPKNYSSWPKGRPRSLNYPDIPVYKILTSTATKFPDMVALRFMGIEITYRELDTLSTRFANGLLARGVKKGDRIAVHLPNCPQFAIAYYAMMKIGAVFVPCSPLMVEREIEYQLNDSGAETLITLDLLSGSIENILEKTKIKNHIVTTMPDNYPPVSAPLKMLKKSPIKKGEDFLNLLNDGSEDPINVDIDPKKDIAHLGYTGGTTGLSKGVIMTHYNVVANVLQIAHWFGGGNVIYEDGIISHDMTLMKEEIEDINIDIERPMIERMTVLVVVPWFHVMGSIGYLNFPIYSAMTMIVFPRLDAVEYIRAVDKYNADVMGGAPQLYIPLLEDPEFKKVDMSRIKFAVSAAAPLPVPVLEKMLNAFSGVVCEGYGLTEVTGMATMNPPSREASKAGSVGLPVFDTFMKVVDVKNNDVLPQGEEGELCIKGPQCMGGYWNRADETKAVLKDGWLYTGDIGYEDEEGYFYITDRKKDLIIYKGYNVYPRELEELLFANPKVVQCAVVGKKTEKGGEIPVAFIQLKADVKATADEMMEFVNKQVAPYKQIREVHFIDELPVSGAGKILKRVLKERL
jgi:long-chain acyl-CoA synthetase